MVPINNKGTTFIETVFALTIFCICVTPLMGLLFQSVKNYEFSANYYKDLSTEAVSNGETDYFNAIVAANAVLTQLRGAVDGALSADGNLSNMVLQLNTYNFAITVGLMRTDNADSYFFSTDSNKTARYFFDDVNIFAKDTNDDAAAKNLILSCVYEYKIEIGGANGILYELPGIL